MNKFEQIFFEASSKKTGLELFKEKHGIVGEKADPSHVVCSIGFSENEQKWYGWSHRAIHGFKIGDVCKSTHSGVGDKYTFNDGDTLKTIDDCKQRAIDFAKSVS